MKIKHFEEIDADNLQDYYSKQVEIQSRPIKIDLNFETKQLKNGEQEKLNSILSNIQNIISDSWKWILNDYKNGEDVKEYISFHLEDFFEDDPEEILKGTDPSLDNNDRFIQTLKVNRVGIYPSSPDSFIVIDWMTNPELSNYILVVNLDKNIKLNNITVES